MASRTAHTLHAQSSLSALAPDGAAQVPSSNATLRHGPFEDAQALFAKKIESITDAVYELEMPTKGF